jgi:dTDP-4-dehydrorhamnose 3,5-epimerase
MDVHETDIDGVLRFVPQPHRDARGLFTRTFDAAIGARHKVVFGPGSQDSQSRSEPGVLRGLHGRLGDGESKLVRVSAGAVLDVVVDARPTSPTFGRHIAVVLDDQEFAALWIPAGCLHGFQVLRGPADVQYRIDRAHDPSEDVAVRYDDPDLGIAWRPGEVVMSDRDRAAGSWAQLVARL